MSERNQDASSLCEFSIILMGNPVTHKNNMLPYCH